MRHPIHPARILTAALLAAAYILPLAGSAQTGETSSRRYWIFLTDKPGNGLGKAVQSTAKELDISLRALERRQKRGSGKELIDWYDLPVSPSYRYRLEALGAAIHLESRWLNGVSAQIPSGSLEEIRKLPFVKAIRPVGSAPLPLPREEAAVPRPPAKITTFDYGPSYTQDRQINIPAVHDLGLNGEGVLIGMLDTGFDHQGRTVFSQMDIKAEYDFYGQDSVTANQEGDAANQHNHGTMTLSVIGGFQEGQLIGPAYGAGFLLGKTEWEPSEMKIEEDNWVAGIEWMEREGADVVSSSLGYTTFDSGPDYSTSDLDGNTCVTTRAADRAASKGVVVVNSAGNERLNSWGTLVSPADGDSVIAAGAVDFEGDIMPFSSPGPTADGRIKPDVVAMGGSVYTAYPSLKGNSFAYVNGTSFSCPLTAGVCALVLQAHPELNPMEVGEALRRTADRSTNPNNNYGWGLIDAEKAVFYYGPVCRNFSSYWSESEQANLLEVEILSLNDLDPDSVYFSYALTDSTFGRISGIAAGNDTFRFRLPSTLQLNNLAFYIETREAGGETHTNPFGAPERLYSFDASGGSVIINPGDQPGEFTLYQNYPNPFNSSTTISFDLPGTLPVKLTIYSVRGRRIATLIDRELGAGKNTIRWNGTDDSGAEVGPGVYFYLVKAGSVRRHGTMIYLK